MENNPPSLLRAHDLLREIRQAIRKVELAIVPSNPTTTGSEDSVIWTTSSIEVFNNLSIRTVAAARDALADARHEAEQRAGDINGASLMTKVVQAERDLDHLRTKMRRAVAARKRHEEEKLSTASRAELFRGNAADETRQAGRQQDAVPGGAAGEAREMKLSLRRTRRMMAEQLERVAQVSEIVGEQDALLRDTFTQHKGIGGTMRRAHMVLVRLVAADMMDTVLMVASTCLFFGTVCFILYQRLPLLGLL